MCSLSQLAPKASHFVLWLWWTVERVSAILTLRAVILKNDTSLKYCRSTCIYLASEPRISVVSAHSFNYYADKDSKSYTLLHTLLVATPLFLCEGEHPTYNLTALCNYSQRSAYVKFPCKRFSLSTIATIRQWHLFLPHVLHANR